MRDRGLPATVDLQNHRIAILALGEREAMPVFDWRSPEVYERAQGAEITGFAWECLRRNPHYQREHDEIVAHDLGVTADFRRRWGICFRG
jgi:Proteobacterial transcriptional regulator-like domain